MLTACLGAALQVALPYTDHAVLQSGKSLPVWGQAIPGVEVSVSLSGRTEKTRASASGEWQVDFAPFASSSQGVEMKIVAGDESLIRHDLVFGEVWIATGQSNMRWMLRDCDGGKEEILRDPDPGLRVFNFQGRLHPGGRRFTRSFLRELNATNFYETSGWQRASASSLPEFSGVGYFFARTLRESLDVPIGVIHLGIGGSPMEAHMPSRSFLKDQELHGLLNEWWKNPNYPKWCRDRAALNLAEWLDDPVDGEFPPHPFAPSFLWDAGVAPLIPYPVRGILWYQGESNATEDGGAGIAVEKAINRRKFEALIGSWRSGWRDDALPVYFVQLPGLNRDWELFREMQLEVARELPHVGMAVTIDLGHPTNVHPTNKEPVGQRLARLALAGSYGKDVVANGPQLKEVKYTAGVAELEFDQIVQVSGGAIMKGFEIAGDDRIFHPAAVRYSRQKVYLKSEEVMRVAAIRYAWANDPDGNLINLEGLPASPFRSDSWSKENEAPEDLE